MMVNMGTYKYTYMNINMKLYIYTYVHKLIYIQYTVHKLGKVEWSHPTAPQNGRLIMAGESL